MTMDKEQMLAEQLSRCIDKMNNNKPYQQDEQEIAELMAVAELVKKAAPTAVMPAAMIAQIVDVLAAELTAQRVKKRRQWLYSATIGTAAAVLLVTALKLYNFTPEQPQSYLAPPLEGTVIIEKVAPTTPQLAQLPPGQNITPAADAASKPPALPQVAQAEPAGEQQSAVSGTDNHEKEGLAAARPPHTAADSPQPHSAAAVLSAPAKTAADEQPALLSLAGRQPRSVRIDKEHGIIRQVYDLGDAGEVIVTQKSKATGVAKTDTGITALAPTPAARALTAPADESHSINKVTVTVDGQEVTVEGKLSKEDLSKLAETLQKLTKIYN